MGSRELHRHEDMVRHQVPARRLVGAELNPTLEQYCVDHASQ